MKRRASWLIAAAVSVILLLPGSVGCDELVREAADLIDGVADELDDFADDLDHRHHRRDSRHWLDNVLDDIEDWFD